jgi:hypothetical protein
MEIKKSHASKLYYIRIKSFASALEVQLDKKFHSGTQMFISTLTKAHHWKL